MCPATSETPPSAGHGPRGWRPYPAGPGHSTQGCRCAPPPQAPGHFILGSRQPLPRLRRLRLTPQPRQLPGAAQHFLCLWPGHCLPCPEFLPAVSFHNNKNIRFCSAESGRRWDGHQACAGQGRCVWEAGDLWPRDGPALLHVDPGSSLSAFCPAPPLASLCSGARVPRLPGTVAEHRERTLRGWATRGPPGFCLICQLSPVVISGEPRSRSPEPASCLTTARSCCRQPVPCPVPCHLSR